MSIVVNISKNLNIKLIIKNNIKYILLFNCSFLIQFQIDIEKNNIIFCKVTRRLIFKGSEKSFYILKKCILSLNHYFYKKIKFKGKGYRLAKTKKCVDFMFNKAHPEGLILKNSNNYKLKKAKLIYENTNFFFFKKTTALI